MEARLVFCLMLTFLSSPFLFAQDSNFSPEKQQIPLADCLGVKGQWDGEYKPCTPQDYKDWHTDITHWRAERLIRIGYDGYRYGLPELSWTQSSFMQPQMMVQERYFYDPIHRKIHR